MNKVFSAFRFFAYRIFFKKCGWVGYIGKPLHWRGSKGVQSGTRLRIFPGSRIELKENAELVIGDNVSIGQNLHLTCGEKIIIGKDSVITANVAITDIKHSYSEIDIAMADQPISTHPTSIGKNCFIGYGAVILPGTNIGNGCIIGANAVVSGRIPPYSVVAGAPARIIRRYDLDKKIWMDFSSNTRLDREDEGSER